MYFKGKRECVLWNRCNIHRLRMCFLQTAIVKTSQGGLIVNTENGFTLRGAGSGVKLNIWRLPLGLAVL